MGALVSSRAEYDWKMLYICASNNLVGTGIFGYNFPGSVCFACRCVNVMLIAGCDVSGRKYCSEAILAWRSTYCRCFRRMDKKHHWRNDFNKDKLEGGSSHIHPRNLFVERHTCTPL